LKEGGYMPGMRLTEAIAPSFYEVHKNIKEHKFTHYWFKRWTC